MNFRILLTIFSLMLLVPLIGVTNVEKQSGTTPETIFPETISQGNTSSMKLSIDSPIVITHNDNFSDYTVIGNGSPDSPYLLDDLNIDGAGGSGVNISNTDAYFIIQNSFIFGSTNPVEGAIKLTNVNNGLIRNDTVRDSFTGIYLTGSSSNTLINNTVTNNTYGFHFEYSSDNNTLSNNTATSNAIGFWVVISSNNTLTTNTAIANNQGFDLYFSSNNNTLINNTAISSNFSGFILTDSSNNNTLINNTAINGLNYGFYFVNSSYNNLMDNQAIYNPIGLYEELSDNNINVMIVIPLSLTITVPTTIITTEPVSTIVNTTTETSTTTEVSISTLITQISETITQTAEGFTIIFIVIGMFGLILIRRKR